MTDDARYLCGIAELLVSSCVDKQRDAIKNTCYAQRGGRTDNNRLAQFIAFTRRIVYVLFAM